MSLLSLNVCGLKSKVNCPEFTNYLNDFSIIGLQETKLNDLDHVELEQFDIFYKNRSINKHRRSGGIALLVKKNISKYVTILETKSKLVIWFVVSKQYTSLEQDILCGTVYIPPENSSYATDDPFLEIQLELNDFLKKHTHVCIFGDTI